MKFTLLTMLSCFLSLATFAQRAESSEAIVYKYNTELEIYEPNSKYSYENDDDDESRLRSYIKYHYQEDISDWVISNSRTQDYNALNHLVIWDWEKYENGELENKLTHEYDITYGSNNQIISASVTESNYKRDTRRVKTLGDQLYKKITDYQPISNRYDPTYLLNNGYDLIFDEENRVVEGYISNCRFSKYRYVYGADDRARDLIIMRADDQGTFQKHNKVKLLYPDNETNHRKLNPNFTTFPNPTTGQFILRLSDSAPSQQHLYITDLSGQVVHEFIIDQCQIEQVVDISNLAPGPYLINSGKHTQALKIIKIN